MENPKMRTLPPSPREHVQDGSSQHVLSSPSTGAGPSKMSKVNRSLSTPDNSCASMGSKEPCDSKKQDIPNQGQRDQLYTSLRALVTANPSSSMEVKNRAKTILVAEETVSFILPPDCLISTDLEKKIHHQSSFEERLQGWYTACRRRANGKLDMNYRHGQSKRMCRSTIKVVKFIMEALVDKEPPGSSSPQEQAPATLMKGSSKIKISSSKKERFPPSKSLKISSAEKITIEHLLEESYNNLMNICGSRSAAPESEEWGKYLKSSSENEDNASSDEETR